MHQISSHHKIVCGLAARSLGCCRGCLVQLMRKVAALHGGPSDNNGKRGQNRGALYNPGHQRGFTAAFYCFSLEDVGIVGNGVDHLLPSNCWWCRLLRTIRVHHSHTLSVGHGMMTQLQYINVSSKAYCCPSPESRCPIQLTKNGIRDWLTSYFCGFPKWRLFFSRQVPTVHFWPAIVVVFEDERKTFGNMQWGRFCWGSERRHVPGPLDICVAPEISCNCSVCGSVPIPV